jgi:hypothetical protein
MTKQPSNHPTFQSSSHPIITRWALLGGLFVAAIGASFAPWVSRPPAALVLAAPDLAEFVKFLPEVRNGALGVERLLFLSPLFVAAFCLPLIAASRRLAYPRWVRWVVLIAVIPLALALLPPIWSPGVLLSPEFRLQTAACLLCLGLVVFSRWLRGIPVRPLLVFLSLLSLAAIAPAVWQFYTAREAIARAYASPIVPGWGLWLTVAGFGLFTISTLLMAKKR